MNRQKLLGFLKIPGRSTHDRLIPYKFMLLWALIIGVLGGFIATAYYWAMNGGLYLVWELGFPIISSWFAGNTILTTVIITLFGGVLVGITAKFMKSPGEISAVVNNIHVEQGRMDYKQNPSMLVTSLVSIVFGGSAGPEAPLVQLIGSNGSKLGEKLKLHGDLIRTFTFCGMAAALGAFFGAPIGGALFALEIPHSRGLEYYEALIPSIVSALAAFLVFRSFIGYEGALYHLPSGPDISIYSAFEGVLMGLIGALIAILFIYIFKNIERLLKPLQNRPIILGAVGGLTIGVFAILIPENFITTPLFWSEYQIVDLLEGIEAYKMNYSLWGGIALLGGLVLIKMCSIGVTLHSGFRGGFIFPLFFIGAVSGIAISFATNGAISLPIAIVGLMAAVNVGVTKTPISTSIILVSLTSGAMLPIVALASTVSYVCTERIRLIPTQQHRKDNGSPMHRVWRWNEK